MHIIVTTGDAFDRDVIPGVVKEEEEKNYCTTREMLYARTCAAGYNNAGSGGGAHIMYIQFVVLDYIACAL